MKWNEWKKVKQTVLYFLWASRGEELVGSEWVSVEHRPKRFEYLTNLFKSFCRRRMSLELKRRLFARNIAIIIIKVMPQAYLFKFYSNPLLGPIQFNFGFHLIFYDDYSSDSTRRYEMDRILISWRKRFPY